MKEVKLIGIYYLLNSFKEFHRSATAYYENYMHYNFKSLIKYGDESKYEMRGVAEFVGTSGYSGIGSWHSKLYEVELMEKYIVHSKSTDMPIKSLNDYLQSIFISPNNDNDGISMLTVKML